MTKKKQLTNVSKLASRSRRATLNFHTQDTPTETELYSHTQKTTKTNKHKDLNLLHKRDKRISWAN